MAIESILSQLDAEIAKLQQARALLSNLGPSATSAAVAAVVAPAKRRGRPAKNAKVEKAPKPAKVAKAAKVGGKKKRTLSPEARQRIADAQKRRWSAIREK